MVRVHVKGKWEEFWGDRPVPAGFEVLGTVVLVDLKKDNEGALFRDTKGSFFVGRKGVTAPLPCKDVEEALERSQAATKMGKLGGSVKSAQKTAASRENGRLGGRPRKAV